MEEIQLSPDEQYAEISRNYQEFREKVDEFNKSTTKCKDAIARFVVISSLFLEIIPMELEFTHFEFQ